MRGLMKKMDARFLSDIDKSHCFVRLGGRDAGRCILRLGRREEAEKSCENERRDKQPPAETRP